MLRMVLEYYAPNEGEREERPDSFHELIRRLEELRVKDTPLVGCSFSVDIVEDNPGRCIEPEFAERLSVGIGNGEWMIFYNPGLDRGPML